MQPGMTPEEADRRALAAASALRAAKVASGKARVKKTCEHQGGIRGVYWAPGRKGGKGTWRVAINVQGKEIYGRCFHPKDDSPEEVENARLAAVGERGRLEFEHYNLQVGTVGGAKKRCRTK